MFIEDLLLLELSEQPQILLTVVVIWVFPIRDHFQSLN